MPTSNSSFNSGPSFPLVLMMHIFTKKKNEKIQQLIWHNPLFFFFFKASHRLKTVLLKHLCGRFYLEVHFQIQSLLCVGSLLLLLPLHLLWVVCLIHHANTMRDKNLSHDWVREKCRKELCINPTVWGGLVLFWNHTISLLQIPLFCHCTDTLSGGDASLQGLPIPVHCVTSFQSAHWPLGKKEACSGLLSFVFVMSLFPLCFTLVCLILWMTLNYVCKYLVIERTFSLSMLRMHACWEEICIWNLMKTA